MKLAIIIIIAIFVSSCNNESNITEIENPNVIVNGEGIMPLSVGNIWNYKEYEYQDESLLAERDIKLEVMDKIHVDYNNQNIEVFKLKETRIFNGNNPSELYFLLNEENDTIYWYGHSLYNDDEYYFNKTIYVKYLIEVGENWIMDHGDYYDEFSCESINDTVAINNLNYECIRIRMGNEISYEDTYFSFGLGIIQIESNSGWEINCNLRRQILVSIVIK
jgi:hypothetical protein